MFTHIGKFCLFLYGGYFRACFQHIWKRATSLRTMFKMPSATSASLFTGLCRCSNVQRARSQIPMPFAHLVYERSILLACTSYLGQVSGSLACRGMTSAVKINHTIQGRRWLMGDQTKGRTESGRHCRQLAIKLHAPRCQRPRIQCHCSSGFTLLNCDAALSLGWFTLANSDF